MNSQTTSPANFGELLLGGFRLFKTSIKDIISIVVIQIITMTFLLLVTASMLLSLMADSTHSQPGYGMLAAFVLAGLSICGICLIFPVAYIKKFQKHLIGEEFSSKHAFQHSLAYLKNILFWFITYSVIIIYLVLVTTLAQHFVLLLVLAIPGFMLLISLSMGPFLIVVDEYGPLAAIRQSYLLVRGRWWGTALYLLVTGITIVLVYLTVAIPISFLFAIISGANPMLIGALNIINTLLFCSLLPLFIALIFPYYCELKQCRITG